jgi:ribosomal subunit interface protein
MHIKINGKHIDVGDALRAHVEERLEALVEKYFDNAVDSTVTFSREAHLFKCDAQVHLSTGLNAKATASADEIYAALDSCVDRIEKQLRRYKRRLKDHHAARGVPVEATEAPAYVIQGGEHEEEPSSLDPVIVAEMTMNIQTISVGEAVMQMELAHAPFLMFRNERHGGFNVVYRRDDGHIGWVDPENLIGSKA